LLDAAESDKSAAHLSPTLQKDASQDEDLEIPQALDYRQARTRYGLLSNLCLLSAGSAALVMNSYPNIGRSNDAPLPFTKQADFLLGGSLMYGNELVILILGTSTRAFTLAGVVFTISMITYWRTHRDEKYQAHALLAGLIIAVLLGALMGLQVLLVVLPWVILCSLSGGSVLHLVRLRSEVNPGYSQGPLLSEKV
jgi:hypothetical protein